MSCRQRSKQPVREMELLQSMSPRRTIRIMCQHNNFGHFKDEVGYQEAESPAELHTQVMDYMEHYNHIYKQ